MPKKSAYPKGENGMKRLLKELFYWLLILIIIGFIGLFFLYPIIESGLEYQKNMETKLQKIDNNLFE